MPGKVLAINIGTEKGKAKKNIHRGCLEEDYGLVGDIHSGSKIRQVSLLGIESLMRINNGETAAQPGDFAENITTEGIDFSLLTSGTRLRIGEAIVEVAEFGKKEWKEGDYSFKGVPLLAKEGVFARVLRSSIIRIGDKIEMVDGNGE